jgi:hypothetical protein
MAVESLSDLLDGGLYLLYSTSTMLHFFLLSALFFFVVVPVVIWCFRMLVALSLYFHPDVIHKREIDNNIIRQAKANDKAARKAAKAKTKWVWRQDPNNPGRNTLVEVPNVPEDTSNWPQTPVIPKPQNEGPWTAQQRAEALERGFQKWLKDAEVQEAQFIRGGKYPKRACDK